MFKKKKTGLATIQTDGTNTAPKKRGPVKYALLALRDWVLYYAIMVAVSIALSFIVGGLADFVAVALVQAPAAYFIGRKLMKKRPEGTVLKFPKRKALLLALAYTAIIIPSKIAFHDLSLVAGGSYGGPMIEILMLVLIAPISEELLYRGVLFPLAERRTGFWPAAIMNAIVFALAHFPNIGNMITAVTMSLLVCALQSTTGRTRYCILIHWIFNILNIPLAVANPTLPIVICIMAIAAAGVIQVAFCVNRNEITQKLAHTRV